MPRTRIFTHIQLEPGDAITVTYLDTDGNVAHDNETAADPRHRDVITRVGTLERHMMRKLTSFESVRRQQSRETDRYLAAALQMLRDLKMESSQIRAEICGDDDGPDPDIEEVW